MVVEFEVVDEGDGGGPIGTPRDESIVPSNFTN